MENFVRVLDETGGTVHKHPDLVLTPQRWADMLYGGPDKAAIRMTGPSHAQGEAIQWLYYTVHIIATDGTTVWWGYIHEVSGDMIHARGWWHMLEERYYENLKGREENVEGTAEVPLGLGFTSQTLGTLAYSDIWYEHDAKFANFDAGAKFTVSTPTPATNDGTYTLKSGPSSESQKTYTATTISFEVDDDIKDSASLFKDFRPNEYCLVSGSTRPDNNRYHLLTSAAPAHMTTREGITGFIVAEVAGTSITIEQGNAVDVIEPVSTYQIPGAIFTATGQTRTVVGHGEKIAQQFYNNSGEAFTVDRIAIKIRKVGSPVDNVTVALYSDSAGSPGSLLDSGTILAADITTKMSWHWADLANTYSIATGTPYYIHITRTGSNDPDDFYKVAVDDGLNYGSGYSVKLWDGNSWEWRATDADLTFRVHGAVATTTQISDVITTAGQVFDDVTIFDASGIEINQYHEGLDDGREVVESMLDQGVSDGDGLMAAVTIDKAVAIKKPPTSAIPNLLLASSHAAVFSTNLEDVYNRVQVFYTYTDGDGNNVSTSTDWSADNDSVTRYGYRELRHSETDLTSTQADALRDRILAESKWPTVSIDLADGDLLQRYGAPVPKGSLVSGQWLAIADPPGGNAEMVTVTPILIAASQYDAINGRLTITPQGQPAPWDIGGIDQG